MSKGSKQRPTDQEKFKENWERIFGKPKTALLLLMLSLSPSIALAVNLQEYLVPSSHTYASAGGYEGTRYTFSKGSSTFTKLYKKHWKAKRTGSLYTWSKDFKVNGVFKHKVTQPLWYGLDESVIELGGVKAKGITSYSKGGSKTGLYWSGKGGLSPNFVTNTMAVLVNNSSIGMQAYSRVKLVELLPEYTPEYGKDANGVFARGNSRTYTNVVHLIMYHGTNRGDKPIRCWNKPRLSDSTVEYIPMKNYNSYTMELWIAKGVGIIKHVVPYIEDGHTTWGQPNCIGNIYSGNETYTNYLYD